MDRTACSTRTWLVSVGNSRWAALLGQMYFSRGTPAYTSAADVKPWKRKPPPIMSVKGGPISKLWKLYDSTRLDSNRTN